MDRIFEHIPNWFTFTCWGAGGAGILLVLITYIAEIITKARSKRHWRN